MGLKGKWTIRLKYLAELRDPRVERNREHLLEEILLIAIAVVLSGAESWNDIAENGKSKREWLKTFLTLPFGIPSHDTFNQVFAALDPEEMEMDFIGWVSSIATLTAGEVVAIDGKTLCGTRETGKKKLVHMVSAWAEGNGLVLGQRKVDEKSNEVTAVPKLLNALELAGAVVTIDAMGCRRQIAKLIVEKKADYVLAVKDLHHHASGSRSCPRCCAPHRDDRVATVISGTWHIGGGDRFKESKLKALPPGSYHTEPPGQNHFAEAGDEPVVVQITGFGPSSTDYVDHGNDPRISQQTE